MCKVKRSIALLALLLFANAMWPSSMLVHAADRSGDGSTHTGPNGSVKAQDNGQPDSTNDTCKGSGSPVYLQDMTFLWRETDVALAGRPALALSRFYNSFDGREGIFGKGWTGNCERSLIKVFGLVEVGVDAATGAVLSQEQLQYVYRSAEGRTYIFGEDANGKFAPPAGMNDLAVQETATGARLVGLAGEYQEFNALGQLIADVDRNGNAVHYAYSENALTRIADDNGRSLALSYDSSGHVAAVQDHSGRQWKYSYNPDGTLASVEDPLQGVRRYTYQSFTPSGSGQSYALLTKITDATSVTVVSVTYDARTGKVMAYTEGTNTYRYTIASDGTITKTDSQNATWRYVLDGAGRKTKITDPMLHTTTFNYDANGALTETIDVNGNTLKQQYDARGVPTQMTSPLDTTTVELVDGKPWPKSVASAASGRKTSYEYDAKGNVTKIDDLLSMIGTFNWSDRGDLTAVTDAIGNATEFTVNAIGLTTSAKDAAGRTTQFDYDARGNLVKVTDPLGRAVATMTYDALDRLSLQRDAAGREITYGYDASGRIQFVQAPNGKRVQYTYDGFGRIQQRTDYDGAVETYAYRPNSLVDTYTDKAGVVTQFSYNANRQVTTVNVGGEVASYDYNVFGQLISATNESGTVTFGYDQFGRMTQETNNGQTITYAYNTAGDLASYAAFGTTYPYTYDQRGRLTAITTPAGDITFAYDNANRRTTLTYPNGSKTVYGYDPVNQLKSQQFTGPFIATYEYDYDDASRMTAWRGDGTPKSYEYDLSDQLTRAVDSFGDTNYQYDSMNNRVGGGQKYDDANRLLEDDAHTYIYDANGSLIEKTQKTTGARTVFTWNRRNQLIQVDRYADSTVSAPSTTSAYAYDAVGRRVSRTVDGSVKTFVYNGLDRIGTLDANAVLLSAVTFGSAIDEPLLAAQAGDSFSYHANHQGSIMALSSASTVATRYEYDAFGRTRQTNSGSVNFFQYTGREAEADDLYYYRARFYEPGVGRFISSDPIGLLGGINTYAYVGGNPVSWRDPLGLWAGVDDAIFAGGGALAGIVGQGISDWLSGSISGWEDYVGSAVGGAAFGETLLYAGPVAAGLVGGAVTNASKQGLKNSTGKQCGFNWTNFGVDTAVGGLTGLIPGRPRIPGINSGRNSMNAIYNQMATKFRNGTISNVSATTAGKMFVGRAYETAVPYGVAGGALAGAIGGPLIPGYSDSCACK